jgi:DNA helicase HerA-like ATPase
MKAIAIIGMKGTGKTTTVKAIISKLAGKKYVYDVNREYSKSEVLPDFDEFLAHVATVKNSVIVFEEASVFLSNAIQARAMKNIMIRTRHTNNFVVFVFHAIRQLPVDIFEGLNAIVLKKTNERLDILDSKYKHNPDIIRGHREAQNSPDRFFQSLIIIQ